MKIYTSEVMTVRASDEEAERKREEADLNMQTVRGCDWIAKKNK